MKFILNKAFFFLILACILFCVNGCGGAEFGDMSSGLGVAELGGTDSGNPDTPPYPNALLQTSSGQIALEICKIITECFPHPDFPMTGCIEEILEDNTLDERLGLIPDVYGKYLYIVNAEYNDLLTPDRISTAGCLSTLQLKSCDDMELLQAYNENRPGNLSRISELIQEPEEDSSQESNFCSSVFNLSPES